MLSDFEQAQTLPNHDDSITLRKSSLPYLAPELLNSSQYDTKIDVWSATIIVFSLLTGTLPFDGKTP